MSENVELRIAGRAFAGWYRCEISRSVERGVTEASFDVTENQLANAWMIAPFMPCTIYAGDDLLMTGYVVEYGSRMEASSHVTTIIARSKTQDIVDSVCAVPFQSIGRGYTLPSIAATMCAPFGINIVTEAAGGDLSQFLQLLFNLDETIFGLLERLARTQGILLTDNPNGDLVLTNAGSATSSSAVVLGSNVMKAELRYNVQQRFNKYIVRGQSNFSLDAGGSVNPSTQIIATATDTSMPQRNRIHAITIEMGGDVAFNQKRADWLMKWSIGQSKKLHITLPGWREANGNLFTPNTMTPCILQELGINEIMLLVDVKYLYDNELGFRSELRYGPVDGYKPDPGVTLPFPLPSIGGAPVQPSGEAGGH